MSYIKGKFNVLSGDESRALMGSVLHFDPSVPQAPFRLGGRIRSANPDPVHIKLTDWLLERGEGKCVFLFGVYYKHCFPRGKPVGEQKNMGVKQFLNGLDLIMKPKLSN